MKKQFILLLLMSFGVFVGSYAQCWNFVSGGRQNTFGIKADSTLWGWGDNTYGQLADGTFNNYAANLPQQISPSKAHNWASVSVGQFHVVSRKTDGTLWAWGDNFSGQLGIGNSGNGTGLNITTQIGSFTDWKTVLAAGDRCIAIKTNGTLWSWGLNDHGQLGDGTYADKDVPIQIGTSSNWKSVSISGYHTTALKTDGTLWTWGRNRVGQLGDGTIIDKNVPTQIGTANDWDTVCAGADHTLALKTDGTLWAWGYNYYGTLGDGTYGDLTDKHSPIQIGTATDWKSITASNCSLALKTDNSLWSWGDNTLGQLGDGTNIFFIAVPTRVGTLNDWKTVYAASFGEHVLSIKFDSSLWAWGYNGFGQIGDGTYTDKNIPTEITCLPASVLPVTLISFNAFLQSGNVTLQWRTSQEINASKFVIEKSITTNEWADIGIVDAIGNSNSVRSYSFYDHNVNGTCYYRLRMIDIDRKITYSKIEKVKGMHIDSISFYPNPSHDFVFISNLTNKPIKKIAIINCFGKKILEETTNFSRINISNFAKGIYVLMVFSKDETYQFKLIKQ